MTAPDAPRTGLLIAAMAGLVALGFPMIYVLWDALNQVLLGDGAVGRSGVRAVKMSNGRLARLVLLTTGFRSPPPPL